MAQSKRSKVAGSFYKGYALTVNAGAGAYTLDMAVAGQPSSALSGLTVIPSEKGSGDSFKIEHVTADNTVVKTLAETVPNIGKSVAIQFDLAALELVPLGNKIRLTYTNVAGVAMTVNVLVERLK